MSDYETVCSAIADDLRNNVAGLVEVKESNVHLLAPWSAQELAADGEKHLAVWPVGENAESAEPLTTGSHMLNQGFAILYWESSATEAPRLVEDQVGAAALLDLHNAIRARIYRDAFQTIGSSDRAWYVGTSFPEQVSRVRGFQISLSVRRFIDFTS